MSWLIRSGMGSYSPEAGWDYTWDLLGDALLVERHPALCRCTYCQRPRKTQDELVIIREPEQRRVGYTAPPDKGQTSWYRLHWKRPTGIWYLRWTKRGLREMFRRRRPLKRPPTTSSTESGEDQWTGDT